MDRLSLNIEKRLRADQALVPEKKVQSAFCRYLDEHYHDILYSSSPMGLKMTLGMAKEVKGHNSHIGLPDMTIYEARGGYHGLVIELKSHFSKIYKLDGTLKNCKHTRQQAAILKKFQSKGYYAVFGCGLKDCINITKEYMSL